MRITLTDKMRALTYDRAAFDTYVHQNPNRVVTVLFSQADCRSALVRKGVWAALSAPQSVYIDDMGADILVDQMHTKAFEAYNRPFNFVRVQEYGLAGVRVTFAFEDIDSAMYFKLAVA